MNQDYVISKAYSAGLMNGVGETSFALKLNKQKQRAIVIVLCMYRD